MNALTTRTVFLRTFQTRTRWSPICAKGLIALVLRISERDTGRIKARSSIHRPDPGGWNEREAGIRPQSFPALLATAVPIPGTFIPQGGHGKKWDERGLPDRGARGKDNMEIAYVCVFLFCECSELQWILKGTYKPPTQTVWNPISSSRKPSLMFSQTGSGAFSGHPQPLILPQLGPDPSTSASAIPEWIANPLHLPPPPRPRPSSVS